MIRWMLAQMEKNPHRVFYQKELEARFPEDFSQAVRERLLSQVPLQLHDGVVGLYDYGLRRPYTVFYDHGVLEAFDDEDLEAEPITLTRADLVQWTLELPAFAEIIQKTNGLSGQPGPLSECLYFVGEREDEGLKTAWVVALLSNENIAVDKLSALTGLLPRGYHRRMVLCPTFQPSPAARRKLQGLGLEIVPMEFSTLDSPTLAEPSGNEVLDLEFQHWDGYRQVRWRGQMIALAPLQAEVVQALHSALNGGTPGLSWDAISSRISGNAGSMSDIFRNKDPRKQLVEYERRGRTYRLNI